MRAAAVTNHHSARQATKKQASSTLIDQGLFWSQIRKYQLTNTYRSLSENIQREYIDRRNASSSSTSNRKNRSPFKRRMSGLFGRGDTSDSSSSSSKLDLRNTKTESFLEVEKLNRNGKLNKCETNNNNHLIHRKSSFNLINTTNTKQLECCHCCHCCINTPTFDPTNVYKMAWDFFVAILIFYSVVMIPYMIGFNVNAPTTMVIINWIVDCTFAVDMCFNFFTGYRVDGDTLVTSKCAIAITYLKGWFVVDLFSTLPIDTIASNIINSTSGSDSSGDNSLDQQLRALKLIRGLRLLRLLKLARVLKLKRIQRTLDESDFFNPAMMKVFGLLFKIIFVAHILSCFWFLVGSPEANDSSHDGWVTELNIIDKTDSDKYSWSFYWTVATMMAVGYGDVHPRTTQEMLYAILAQTVGA
jgi:hypothetical protein